MNIKNDKDKEWKWINDTMIKDIIDQNMNIKNEDIIYQNMNIKNDKDKEWKWINDTCKQKEEFMDANKR